MRHLKTILFTACVATASSNGTQAQSFSADEGKKLRPVTEYVANALLSELGSAARLTAEGQVLHENTKFPNTWGNYCASAMALNEEGEFRRAVRAASMALFLGEQSGNRVAMAFGKRDLAVAFSYTGNLDLAERYARESLNITNRDVAMVSHKTLGDVAMRRGDFVRALVEYEFAIQYSSSSWKSLVQVSLASAYLAKNDLSKARTILDELTGSLRSPIAEQVQRARGNLALKEGRPDDALRLFQQLGESGGSDSAYHRAWAKEGEARARRAKGDRSGAIEALLAAVAASEAVRARFRSEEFKTGMFGELQEIFAAAVALLIEAGQAEKALDVAEAGRSRALLDQVRGRVKSERGVAFARAESAQPSAPSLRSRLAPTEAAIAYYVTPVNVIAWVIESTGIRAITLPVGRDELRADVHRLRTFLSERSPSAFDILRKLHAQLIEPLTLSETTALVFIPHNVLHHVPFHALRDARGYLIERAEISYAPSAATLVHLLDRRRESRVPSLFALGNPDLGHPKLSLPGAEREVKVLHSIFPGAQVLVQKEATKPAFFKGATRHSLVHVAAHAEFDALDPLYSRIRLASSEESSGVLEAHEIYGVDLGATAMVTLSACESGMAQVTSGDEIWGFSRSFLSAGTPALIVSLWPVADESTEKLMTEFYRGLRAKSPRTALRDAQLAVLRDPAFSHPFFWSPFTLVGDWR